MSKGLPMFTLRTSTQGFWKVRNESRHASQRLTVVTDSAWTKEETDYLFNLVREYDGRFYVVHDRYEWPSGPERTLEVSPTPTVIM